MEKLLNKAEKVERFIEEKVTVNGDVILPILVAVSGLALMACGSEWIPAGLVLLISPLFMVGK